MLLVLTCLAADAPKLRKVKVNEQLTISVPQDWHAMDIMDFTQRYPSVRAPLAAYTDMDRQVDFSVNISATQWPDTNLEIAQQFFKASVKNMFDKVTILQEGIREVNKRKFIYFEFESSLNGDQTQENLRSAVGKYTYIQYYLEPGRTLVFSFNSPVRFKGQWRETAQEMMERIKIK